MIGRFVRLFDRGTATWSYRWGRTEPGRATITIAITVVSFALLWLVVTAVYALR